MTPEEVALERYQIIRTCLAEGASREETARAAGVTSRTIHRWIKAFKRDGLSGLTPRHRSDNGGRRAVSHELAKIIEGLCLRRPPLPVSAIHRTIQALCQRNQWRVPSYDVVNDIAIRIAPDLRVLAHDGEKAYEQAFDLLHRYEAETPNELWQADHTTLDILVFDSSGRIVKPWLTAIIDDYSRAVPGYYLGTEPPSSMRIALALRQAIWRKDEPRWTICGIPDKFYSDRGSDFMSKHVDQVSVDLKIELLQTLPQKPKGKGKVERFFETVDQMFLTGQPGYAPRGATGVQAVLKLEELDERLHAWIIDEYMNREHSETNQAPKTRWESFAFIPRMPDSREQLDILLMTVAKPRKVQRDGIRFQGYRYFDVMLQNGYIGEEVTIRYDPRDLAEILVYAENQFVCRAVCFELSDKKVTLKEVIRARTRRRRELREQLKDLLQTADRHVPGVSSMPPIPSSESRSEPAYPKFKIKRFACDE